MRFNSLRLLYYYSSLYTLWQRIVCPSAFVCVCHMYCGLPAWPRLMLRLRWRSTPLDTFVLAFFVFLRLPDFAFSFSALRHVRFAFVFL